jgi:redox-sensitive bicupin YhaK (pirin superfamily)
MLQVFPAESRFKVDQDWMRSRLSFSFGSYFDPNNTSFGVMRVCNDDEVDPGKGFGAHPHSDMEIVTVVLEGAIRHEDSLGNSEVAKVGEIQRMSAGSGTVHAEYNASDTEPMRILQLWFMPSERGIQPSYETGRYDQEKLNNALLAIVDPQGSDHTAKIHQDLTIYLGKIDAGHDIVFEQSEGRRVFLFVIEGSIHVNGKRLGKRDTARVESLPRLEITAEEDAFIMLIDLP